MDWNDLKYFLSVADQGSTLRAATDMRVSQTTVARRIAALEEAIGLRLFDRRQAGYALTPVGTQLVGHAREVERAASSFGDAAAAESRDFSGVVRITSEEIYAHTLLGPMLAELHERHPLIHIQFDATGDIRDLGAGEADIALRATSLPQPAGIFGRRLCFDAWALYCSRDYAAAHGIPRNVAELKGHALIGGGGGNLWRAYKAWIHEVGLEEQVAMHHGSSTGLLSAVRSSFGIAVLPSLVADTEPDLIRCLPPRRDHEQVLWLVTHERVRHSPRVRTVIDFLYERLKKRVSDLNLAT